MLYLYRMHTTSNQKNTAKSKQKFLPHIRLLTLFVYFIFILLFNVFISPALGLGSRVEASSIDPNGLVVLANQDRASAGLPGLTVDQRLINAATNKAINMFKEQYWSHYGPNGETPWQFIIGAGYQYTYAGENLAKDFSSTSDVNTAWMNSASHRANILNSNYTNIGIATVSGKQICNGSYPDFASNNLSSCINTVIVVQMFGTPVGGQPASSLAPISPSAPSAPKSNYVPTHVNSTPVVNTPVSTPIPSAPSTPNITLPQNNAILNQSKIEIKGSTDDNTSVDVFEGDKKLGTISSSSGSFDIKDVPLNDGDHLIKAIAKKNNDTNSPQSAYSSEVKVSIDTQKPNFENSSIKLQLNDQASNEYYIEGNAFTSDTVAVKVTAQDVSINLDNKGNNTFSGIIKVPATSIGVVISAFDKAGNEYDGQVSLVTVPITKNVSLANPAIPNSIKPNLNSKQLINIIIGVFLLMIFGVDSILVWRSGRRNNLNGSRLHEKIKGSFFHHIIPMVFVVFSIVATLGGNVL